MNGAFIQKDATLTVDTGDTGYMDEVGDQMVVDVSDMTNISLYLNQITDDGNVTFLVEKTVDGVNWATVDSAKDQDDLPAGANTALELTLSDANGMPLRAKQLRVTLSVHTGTGNYTCGVAGTQVPGYR